MRIEQITLKPKMAAEWLAGIPEEKQRKYRLHHAARLAESITRGEWNRNNDMFMLNKNEELVNGQHRASACVMSGKSISITVAYDCTEEEIVHADQGGLARKNDDALHLAGFKNARSLSAMITAIFCTFERRRFRPSVDEALEFAGKNAESLEESLVYIQRAGTQKSNIYPALIGALHFIAKQTNKAEADAFCSQIADGIAEERGGPVWLLLSRMRKIKENNIHSITRDTTAALMVKAYIAFFEKKQIVQLKWNIGAGEEFPQIP